MSLIHLILTLLLMFSSSIVCLAASGASSELADAGNDANASMSDSEVGGTSEECEKCPLCGRKKHDKKYPRSHAERRKSLLASLKRTDLPPSIKNFIQATDGNNVPPGYEVSHDPPLYTLPKSERCKLDKAKNMTLMTRAEHRALHAPDGAQTLMYPPELYKF